MRRIAIAAAIMLFAVSAWGQCLLTTETEAFPSFFVGQPVNFQIVAVSGTEPYKFSIVEGTLPEGLHLTPSGKIVGVPRAESDSVVLFNITDAAGCQLNQAYNVVVMQPF